MPPPPGGALTWPDYAVPRRLAARAARHRRRLQRGSSRTPSDFFLARRRIPWWAACLSFLATEISAVTIISVPATAYSENWEYVQFFVGSSLAKFTVALLFIPAFYRYDCTTIYEFLGHRFGTASQVTGSIFFFVTRLLGSGVRLMAAALAVSRPRGLAAAGDHRALHRGVHRLHRARRREGGGVDQCVPGRHVPRGRLRSPWSISPAQIDGGLGAMFGTAAEAGRLSVINWGPAPGDPDFWRRVLTDPNIVWLAVLNGLVGSMAAFGTDHDLMQRLLTVETRRREPADAGAHARSAPW